MTEIGGQNSSYPRHGGGWSRPSREDPRYTPGTAQKPKPVRDAATVHHYVTNTLKLPAPKSVQDEMRAQINANERDSAVKAAAQKKAEIHKRNIDASNNLDAWNADNERRAKDTAINQLSSGTKITGANLEKYTARVSEFTEHLHRALRDYPNDVKIQAFAKEARATFTAMFTSFDHAFQAGLKIASGMYKLTQGNSASMSGSAGGVDLTDAVNEMVRSLHEGSAATQSGRSLVHDNDFTSAFANAVSAHASFVSAATDETRFSDAMIKGANRIIDLLHDIENDCESAINILDSAVTGGKFAAIFPTIVDTVEATSSAILGQEHKSWQEITMNGIVDILFLRLDKYMKEPVTEELKEMIEVNVKKLTKGVAKKILWVDVYTAATESYKTLFKAIAGEYWDSHKSSNEPINWKKVEEEVWKKWQQDFATGQAAHIAGYHQK